MPSCLFLCILWFGIVCGQQAISPVQVEGIGGPVRRYIVELENTPGFGDVHEPLYAALKSHHVGFKVDKEYRSQGVFYGAAVTLDDPEVSVSLPVLRRFLCSTKDVTALENAPGVIAVRPVRTYSRPEPIKMIPVNPLSSDGFVPVAESQSSHVMTGVDKLHAKGITGEGIKVGIIDTGIDYTHPALGDGFGPGFKVLSPEVMTSLGMRTNTPVPDPDPLDQCYGHGTHVAGILGANPGNPANISGVAYSASIYAYRYEVKLAALGLSHQFPRIFGCSGDSTDDIIVDALLRGVADGQDILTLSIGQPDGWTEGTTSVVASRIAANGTVVTVAAGESLQHAIVAARSLSGASGPWFTSAPANSINAISVGSVDNAVIFLNNVTVHGVKHDPITYYSLSPFSVDGIKPVWATSNDTTITDDACNPLPASTPNLTDYIALIRRGNCTFVQKATNAFAKGAQTILIYDNGTGFTLIDAGNFTTVTLIQAADGEFLVKQFAAGAPVALSFPQPDQGGSTEYPNPAGGLVSAFTSWGATNDFFFKPAVAAPGGNILSLLPTNKGSYGVAAGTSMATPFVAGAAALIRSVLGKVVDTRTLLETTAKLIPAESNNTKAPLQSAAWQGAGLINVYDALYSTTRVSPGELILNDSAHFVPEHTFTIQNIGDVVKQYQLNHLPAGTAMTVIPGTIFTSSGGVPLTNDTIIVDLSTGSFTLAPGQSQDVVARFTAPPVNTSTFPLYSGFIQISSALENGSTTDTTHVSYIGLAAALKDKVVLDNTNVTLGRQVPLVRQSSGAIQTSAKNYTFGIVNGTSDYPIVELRLVFGTPQLRLDLVDSDFALDNATAVEQLGLLTEYTYVSRNDQNDNLYYVLVFPEPVFANGTRWVPNESYKILVRALRVNGDPSKEADFDAWLSPVIGYYPANTTTV
uniref:Putative pyrolysin n=1 Tax=Moniliophthora roreri TaxID=221103 RepID=A0A0W0EWX6_MONRR